MKKKNFSLKKLTLSKETISMLNEHHQNAIAGGGHSQDTLCEVCIRPITVTCQASVCLTFCNVGCGISH